MTALLAGALAALLLGGCAVPSQDADTTLVVSTDPRLREVVAALLPDLAARAGLELRAPVRVERRSRAQLEGYLRHKLDQELPPDEAEWTTESYHLLGMVPADLDLRALLLDVYTEQVAGFYDPDSTALFILDDQPAAAFESLLVHELVHAVQDQTASLDSLTSRKRGNDRQTAAHAAIEGHATLVMLEHLAERLQGQPVDLSALPDFATSIRPALEAVRAQYPVLAGAPRVVQEALLFPYLEGAGFVQELWRREEGRPAPFGDFLPRSTEQVLEPRRLLADPPDDPLEVLLEPPAGVRVVYENSLGALEVGILVGERLGTTARELAQGWAGDRFVLLEEADGPRSLAWFSVWDDAQARDRFVEALGGGLDGFPRPATLRAVDADGFPGALLGVGGPPEIRATVLEGVER